jgi:hypothetical protein
MVATARDRGPIMNDSTQDPQGRSGSGPEVDVAATSTSEPADQQATSGAAATGEWSDAANDPGSGVPGGGRHKYASGKIYCGTEN